VLALWALASLFALFKTYWIEVVNVNGNFYTCSSSMSDSRERVYTILKWVLAFLVPYSLIIVFSVFLILFLREWSQNAVQNFRQEPPRVDALLLTKTSQSYQSMGKAAEAITTLAVNASRSMTITPKPKELVQIKMKRKSTMFVLAVVFLFLCAWLPLWIFQIVVLFYEQNSLFLALSSNFTLILVYLQGVCDPLLYMLLTENFKRFLKEKNIFGHLKCFN
jgi:hypothetical protein